MSFPHIRSSPAGWKLFRIDKTSSNWLHAYKIHPQVMDATFFQAAIFSSEVYQGEKDTGSLKLLQWLFSCFTSRSLNAQSNFFKSYNLKVKY